MSFPTYPSYQDSGVEWLGEVPSHWNPTRLKFHVHLNPSKSEVSALDPNTEVSFVPMEAVSERGELSLNRTRPISEVLTGYTYFRDGDVSIAKITPCFENGKGAIMCNLAGGVGFGTTELIVARSRPDRTTPEFLDWLFRSPAFRTRGEAAMYGAGGQKRVPDDFVRDFISPGAPLAEQIAIAAFLGRETAKIDALIEEQRRLIALLKEKRQAVISHAVTEGLDPDAPTKKSDDPWLGRAPAHWSILPLASLLLEKKNLVGTNSASSSLLSLTLRGIILRDINSGDGKYPASFDTYKEVKSGNLVFCLFDMDETPRTVGLSNYNGMITGAYDVFQPKSEIVGDFLFYRFLMHDFSKSLKPYYTGLRKVIRPSTFRSIRVAIPPTPEIEKIVDYLRKNLSSLDRLTDLASSSMSILKERRAALISAAVTGKIDVRGVAIAEQERDAA